MKHLDLILEMCSVDQQHNVLEVVIQRKKYFQLQSFLVEVCPNLPLCRCQIPFKSNELLTTGKKITKVLRKDFDNYV